MSDQVTLAKHKVLVVDDNADAAALLAMFLASHGHDVAEANSGQEGLQLAAAFKPEIVFFDLGMPGMSGYDVAVAMRQLPELSDIYISALTGWNDQKTRSQVIAAGFDNHLTKPADVFKILQLVDELS